MERGLAALHTARIFMCAMGAHSCIDTEGFGALLEILTEELADATKSAEIASKIAA